MEMIIGGAYQGKTAYARQRYPELEWVDGASGSDIRRELKEDREVSNLAEGLINGNPGLVIVSQEVGYGVVPVDAFDRKYREAVGRVCTKLAAYSQRVTRVACGIGMVIKGD